MAIDDLYFGVMCSAMDTARRKLPDPTAVMRVGCLSYPDVLVTREQISERYPHLATASYRLRDDAEKIRKWHSMPHLSRSSRHPIFSTSSDVKPISLILPRYGGEIIADLNMPLGVNHHGKYDVVIDTGTLEHCFNVGTAFENMCRMARIGGFIVSAAPMSKVNHGFWNFSPCAYDNYFRQNRFDSIFLGAFYKDKAGLKQIEISPNKRQLAPSEAVLMAIARRTEHSTFNLPIQQKYL